MVQARPHRVELVHQLFVEGTHLRVHQLLVHGQPHSQDVNLRQRVKQQVRSRSGAGQEQTGSFSGLTLDWELLLTCSCIRSFRCVILSESSA